VQSLLLFAAGTGSVQPPLCHCQPLVWLLVSPSQIHPNQSQAMLLYEAVKPLCGIPPPLLGPAPGRPDFPPAQHPLGGLPHPPRRSLFLTLGMPGTF
jgi:hypothetical protein